jgi:hypothetical protein
LSDDEPAVRLGGTLLRARSEVAGMGVAAVAV